MHAYERSGVVPAVGAVINFVVGAGAAAAAAVIYTYTTVYIPFIFLNFLLTVGFGFVIGYAAGKGAVWGKVRNGFFVLVATLFAVGVGIYMEWAASAYIFIEGIGIHAINPLAILALVQALYAEGSWGMSEDSNVTGVFLALIWLIEIGVITGAALLTSAVVASSKPFCETCDQWTELEEGIRYFLPGGGETVWGRIVSGDFEAFDMLERAHGTEPAFVRIDLASCPRCQQSDFITIKAIQTTTDENGKESKQESVIGEHLVASRDQVTFLRGCGQTGPAGGMSPEALLNRLHEKQGEELPPLKFDDTDDGDSLFGDLGSTDK